MRWTLVKREDGRYEIACEHGVGHSPCWWSQDGVHSCDGCCKHPDYPGRKPEPGDLALCGKGRLGLIFRRERCEVAYADGTTMKAWIGLTLPTFTPWSSRNPLIIGRAREVLDLDELLPHFVKPFLLENFPWTNKP